MSKESSGRENSRFARSQALHAEVWKRLGATPAIPAQSPLTLKRATSRWWWTQSEANFKHFNDDSDAQGYELLRRLPNYRQQCFFYDHPEKTWLQIDPRGQVLFTSLYKHDLMKMGLAKQIHFSPRGLDFDCRLPASYLIDALKEELKNPTPLIAGTYGQSLVSEKTNVKELPVSAYTAQCGIWRVVFAPDPYMIHLPLPETIRCEMERKSPRIGDQILRYFTTFVKDKAPNDFAEHRRKFPRKHPKRRPFRKPEKLALALMVLDCGDIAKLTRWLIKSPSMLKSLGVNGTQKQIEKHLYNAPRFLSSLSS